MEMERIYVLDKNEILPIEEVHYTMLFKLFKKMVSGETMERGFCLFEVMEARGKVCFKLREHLERLFSNLKDCRIKIPFTYSIDELSFLIANTLENARLKESILRFDIILGEEGAEEPIFILIKIRPKKEKRPLALKTFKFSRTMPNLKVSGDYVHAQIQKRNFPNYDDILYLQSNGFGDFCFSETSRGNFFIAEKFNDSKCILYSAKSEVVLGGVTRQTLLEIIDYDKFALGNGLTYHCIDYIKEAFVTASSQRIVPVKQIDDHLLDVGEDGKGGPITRKLSVLFDAYVDEWYKKHGAK